MKDYNEIAKKIFERRDKYIAKQKKKKKQIINKIIPICCCFLVLIMSLLLIKGGFSGDGIKVIEQLQNGYTAEQKNPTEEDKTPPANDGGEYNPDNSELPIPNDTPKENEPSDNTEHFIDSIDKVNFYSAKKIIEESSLLPIKNAGKGGSLINLSQSSVSYDKEFTVTKISYFNIKLTDENGFLARKLGGTGLVDVVVIETNIENAGKMITFNRENKYYTCLMSETDSMGYVKNKSDEFSTKRYTEGFNIKENREPENYHFSVHYEGSQVVGFESTAFKSEASNNSNEEIEFIDDYCVVIFTEQTITINQLEAYVKNMNLEDML